MFPLKKLFLWIFFVCALSGCTQEFGERRYHFDMGVSICLPENWSKPSLDPVSAITSMTFQDAKEGSIVLTLHTAATPQDQIDLITKTYSPLQETGPILFTRYKTHYIISTKDRVTFIFYIFKDKQGRVFSLTGTSTSLNFVNYKPTFEKVVRSFKTF